MYELVLDMGIFGSGSAFSFLVRGYTSVIFAGLLGFIGCFGSAWLLRLHRLGRDRVTGDENRLGLGLGPSVPLVAVGVGSLGLGGDDGALLLGRHADWEELVVY